MQAKWVAQVLSGRVALPTQQEMEADMEAFYELLKEKGIPMRYTHCQVPTSCFISTHQKPTQGSSVFAL